VTFIVIWLALQFPVGIAAGKFLKHRFPDSVQPS
jgi:hypothetical protein